MIVISTYNPQVARQPDDEELLTTMLISLVRHVIRCEGHKALSKEEDKKAYWEDQKNNCNRLIGIVYPLLGLDWHEVGELINVERDKWQIDHTGKK